jgi:phytanoyl-CoA hydroxylase
MDTQVKDAPADIAEAAAVRSNEDACAMLNARQAGKTASPRDWQRNLERLEPGQAEAWVRDGFFIIRGLVSPDECAEMTPRIIELFIEAETNGVGGNGHYLGANGLIAVEEAARVGSDKGADLRMSKLFNIHRTEPFKALARHPVIKNVMEAILGDGVACFNSQYIFKNAGVWGQPWHQDSLYYSFDRTPQVGMWLATSKATIENGCLFVAPGSHQEPIHTVVTDRRPGSNYGYLEVIDYNFSDAVPVLMETGDVLIFHSFLMHMSNDNTSDERRSALVYHYADADTEVVGTKSGTIDFMPI